MDVLARRYQLDAPLGTGGTATVWRAVDLTQRRIVAIKVLPHAGGSERLRVRLRAEAEVMASLRHPNVLRVFGLGTDGAVDWIAMEYCPGGSLADQLELSGPLAPRTATTLMIDVLEALAFAHERGVVHRDVKPDNILLGADNRARLCDFGIARVASQAFKRTHTGAALGSWAYMAPEQRIDAHEVGPRADLYSVGCTLYALLTAATPTDLYLAKPESPRWADVPAELRAILRRTTSADPAERHLGAGELTRDLKRILNRLSTQPAPRRQGAPVGRQRTHTHASDGTTERPPVARMARPDFPTPICPPREVSLDGHPVRVPRPAPAALVADPALVIRRQRRRVMAGAALAVGLVVGGATLLTSGDWGTPEASAEEPPPPEPLTVRPEGRWHGLWDSHVAALAITSSGDELDGVLDLTLPGDHRVQLTLEGVFDARTGAIWLHDPGGHPNAADYELNLEPHGNLLQGHLIQRRSRAEAPVLFVRMQ